MQVIEKPFLNLHQMEEIRLQHNGQLTGIPVFSWRHKSQRNRLR